MAKAKSKSTKSTKQKNTGLAIVAYILFLIPLLTDAKDDKFVMYHTKQGLVLFLTWLVVMVITSVPFLGWILWLPLNIGMIILLILGISNASAGKEKELPLIGQYADRINL